MQTFAEVQAASSAAYRTWGDKICKMFWSWTNAGVYIVNELCN